MPVGSFSDSGFAHEPRMPRTSSPEASTMEKNALHQGGSASTSTSQGLDIDHIASSSTSSTSHRFAAFRSKIQQTTTNAKEEALPHIDIAREATVSAGLIDVQRRLEQDQAQIRANQRHIQRAALEAPPVAPRRALPQAGAPNNLLAAFDNLAIQHQLHPPNQDAHDMGRLVDLYFKRHGAVAQMGAVHHDDIAQDVVPPELGHNATIDTEASEQQAHENQEHLSAESATMPRHADSIGSQLPTKITIDDLPNTLNESIAFANQSASSIISTLRGQNGIATPTPDINPFHDLVGLVKSRNYEARIALSKLPEFSSESAQNNLRSLDYRTQAIEQSQMIYGPLMQQFEKQRKAGFKNAALGVTALGVDAVGGLGVGSMLASGLAAKTVATGVAWSATAAGETMLVAGSSIGATEEMSRLSQNAKTAIGQVKNCAKNIMTQTLPDSEAAHHSLYENVEYRPTFESLLTPRGHIQLISASKSTNSALRNYLQKMVEMKRKGFLTDSDKAFTKAGGSEPAANLLAAHAREQTMVYELRNQADRKLAQMRTN